MVYTDTEEKLMDAMDKLEIIDCHEHLLPEKVRIRNRINIFTLFSKYISYDLFSSGLDRDQFKNDLTCLIPKPKFKKLFDESISLEKRWKIFKPYWENVKYTSFSRATVIAANIVYGIKDINDETFLILDEKIRKANKPGLYKNILMDKCKIKSVINQSGIVSEVNERDYPFFPVMPGFIFYSLRTLRDLIKISNFFKSDIPKTLDEYLELIDRCFYNWVKQGAVGIKIISTYNEVPDYIAAKEQFNDVFNYKSNVTSKIDLGSLNNYIVHHIIKNADKYNLTVAVHSGVWDDFRNTDPKHIITLALAYPNVNFDLYHLGIPFVKDAIIISKNYPNVFLNMCWTHILSQSIARSAIDEIIDLVPANKILAFGGDHGIEVENVVGHLHMAKENFAYVLGRRIDNGYMNFDDATNILSKYFFHNPVDLYKLSIKPDIGCNFEG